MTLSATGVVGRAGEFERARQMMDAGKILKTLKEVRYNKSKAARILNIDRKTLYLKMDKYGIN